MRAWAPTGPGLLVSVCALSVVALIGHFALALTLIAGTVHRPGAGSSEQTSPGSSSSSGSDGSSGSVAALHLDHSCLRDHNPATTATIPSTDPFGTDISGLGARAQLQRLYAVHGRDLVAIDGAGPVRVCDQQLWNVVLAATNVPLRSYLKEFLVFDAALGDRSSTFVGEVEPAGKDASQWRLSIAPNGSSDLDVAVTVAHEVGHLISLNAEELATPQPAQCQTFDGGQGCLGDTAYLMSFLDSTWSDDEVTQWNATSDITDDAKRETAVREFYTKHHTSFVDSYAATDPAEDFAESFGIWCAIDKDNPVRSQLIEGDPQNGHAKLDWFEHGSYNLLHEYSATCSQLRQLTR